MRAFIDIDKPSKNLSQSNLRSLLDKNNPELNQSRPAINTDKLISQINQRHQAPKTQTAYKQVVQKQNKVEFDIFKRLKTTSNNQQEIIDFEDQSNDLPSQQIDDDQMISINDKFTMKLPKQRELRKQLQGPYVQKALVKQDQIQQPKQVKAIVDTKLLAQDQVKEPIKVDLKNPKPKEDHLTVFADNIPKTVDTHSLKVYFTQFGRVKDIDFDQNRLEAKILFSNEDAVERAIKLHKEQQYQGHTLNVSKIQQANTYSEKINIQPTTLLVIRSGNNGRQVFQK
ncbi:UNKNOWN [Stylonychia lemnae]|uniref:RRM domain-containing protein n=1 Tax=Stylonychia lemnae TaxID=5949 RepID=A0A078A365_STYLE|nr:UNKNOWN [Stylonychia lemnae]|eukprot:CDW75943.1 UNKNOWN [Stylonychia lemnae]